MRKYFLFLLFCFFSVPFKVNFQVEPCWSYTSIVSVKLERLLESGEINQAKELIEEKYSGLKDHYNLLQARISFYQGDYLSAKEQVAKVLAQKPTDRMLKEIRQFYTQVYEQSKDFREYESEHFRLRVKAEDEILKDYALDGLEKIYRKIGKEFNCYPQEKLLVEVQNTKENFVLTSTLSDKEVETSGAIGICKFNRLIIVSPRLSAYGYRWLDTLSHEYVHYIVNRLTLYHCPLWLHEGIAKYFDRKWLDKGLNYLTPPYENLLANAEKENKLISFSRMSPSLVKLNSQEEVSLAFAEVANTVDYLVRSYGQDKLLSLLNELRTIEDENTAFHKVYGLEQEKIEKDWQANLKGKEMKTYPGASIEKIKLTGKTLPDEIDEFVGTDLRGHIRLGDKFRQRGQYETALVQYKEALEKEPHNPLILNKVAGVYLFLNNKEEAEKKLLNAIRINPDYGASYFHLGNFYLKEKKYPEAEKNYREYIEMNPFDPYLHKNLGLLYSETKEIEKAKKEWLIVKRLLPHDLEVEGLLNQLK